MHSKAMQGVAAAVALALAVVVAACGSSKQQQQGASTPTGKPGAGKPAVTIGDKNFTEQFILGQLYAQALRAKGFTVNVKNDIGSSELIDKALTSGQINGYPEYSGIVLTAIAHDNKSYPSPQATYDAVKKFENGRGYGVLNMTPFNDVDALAVKPAYAKQHHLTQVPDLKAVGRFALGAPPEFKTRFTGLVGMKQIYGITNVNFKPLAIGLQYKALDAGQITGGGRVHDRWPAPARLVHDPQGPEEHLRVPERGADLLHEDDRRRGTRVQPGHQRREREAHDPGHAADERCGRPGQEQPGRGGPEVPAGQQPPLGGLEQDHIAADVLLRRRHLAAGERVQPVGHGLAFELRGV